MAASTALKTDNTIWVWRRKGSRMEKRSWRKQAMKILKLLLHIFVIGAAIAFLVQNVSIQLERTDLPSHCFNL